MRAPHPVALWHLGELSLFVSRLVASAADDLFYNAVMDKHLTLRCIPESHPECTYVSA
ncbi:hypothetical protein COH21_009212 [Aspergillus flavus]|uniref:Uncharacterized protein n=1 Tax=Aspergillus flavus TaxID=5059 RepID=A0AB74C0T8_ASPFL|nr:hypothetical protein COH21_009212 [Aspergillus flavus]RMZ39596.1 hypothetical protein CA14_010036 [Aspergillus flavus]